MALSLAVFLGLASQAAEAAKMRTRAAAPARQVGALEWAWTWVTGWLGGQGGSQGLARLWAEASCGIDPDGRCASTTGDAGFGLDPDGRPVSVTGDMGPGLDPNGR
jgi:hypothetical protein